MKKKTLVSILFLFLISLPAFSQIGVNPENEFYSDALSWELKGYVKKLPQLKPYPENIIKSILDDVLKSNDEREIKRAIYYYQKYFNRVVHGGFDSKADFMLKQKDMGDTGKTPSYEHKELISLEGYAAGDVSFNDLFGLSYLAGIMGMNNNVSLQEVHPKYFIDSNEQQVDYLSLSAGIVDFLLDAHFISSVGTEKIFGTIGFNKTGFGLYPYSDLVLNPNTYQTINLTFNYLGNKMEYSHFMGLLGAKSSIKNNSYVFKKIMAFHSFKMPFFNRKLTLSYYESSVGSTPFMAAFVMPVPFVIMGNVSGFEQNIMAGFGIEWKPLACLAFTGDILFDDITGIKNLIKFKFNEAGIKAALRLGIAYSPLDSICRMITLDYTLVTPYTYTMYDPSDREYNSIDYTSCGINVGSDLPPNSDRVLFQLEFNPFKRMKVTTFSSLVRHSNPYLSLTDEEVLELYKNGPEGLYSDGSINADTHGLSTADNFTNFLTQFTVMYTIQAGANIEYEIANTKTGSFLIGAGYKLEYIRKNGIDTNIYTGTYSTVEEVVNARNAWYDNLHDSVNNYFSVNFKYTY